MRVSLKSVAGVDSVDVSLEKGLAVVKMKPGNTATLKQLNEAITKNGFTMKDSTATVVGTVIETDEQGDTQGLGLQRPAQNDASVHVLRRMQCRWPAKLFW